MLNILKRIQLYYYTKAAILRKPRTVKIKGCDFYLQNLTFDIDARSSLEIQIAPGTKLSNIHFFIRGQNAHMRFDRNVKIKMGTLWIEGDNCSLNIGARTTVEDASFYITERNSTIILGESCMLARDIELRTGDSHSIIDLVTGRRLNNAQNIHFGSRVWIGSHAKILKGVTSGDDVVIGLGSIVSGKNHLESNSIYTGIPARKIKSNILWDRKRI